MERHDFGSTTPNFYMFKAGGVDYCLKEAGSSAVAHSADFQRSTMEVLTDEDGEDKFNLASAKVAEAGLILLERSIYLCDKDSPEDPDKATTLIDGDLLRSWPVKITKVLGNKLAEMSGMNATEEPLGN